MNYNFDRNSAKEYTSNAQKIRVMSEHWVADNMFCPCCGYSRIMNLENNKPVADFQCNNCGEIYELKSRRGKHGKKIPDGAYSMMIERIVSIDNPNLFVLNYSIHLQVINLIFIPKFFFVADIIERRRPLSPKARRAGWVGCNILFSDIPEQGKIKIIENQEVCHIDEVVDKYAKIKKIQTDSLESRGWLLDILECINQISTTEFYLTDVYHFTEKLQRKHMDNHHVEEKIRQQLQFLRDKGFIEFLGRGHYRKTY